MVRQRQASQAAPCRWGTGGRGREKRPGLGSWRDEEAKRGASIKKVFVKENQAAARRDAAQESVGLLEEMSPAAEPRLVEEAAQPGPGCRLAVRPEGRELPQLGETDQRPEWVSPGELGVGAGSGVGGRPADGRRCVDVVVAPLHVPPRGDIGAGDTWVLARVCSSPVLHPEVVVGIQRPNGMLVRHMSPSCLCGGAWQLCKPGCVGATLAASSH